MRHVPSSNCEHPHHDRLLDEPDLFLMSNLPPAHTGLPVVVWISLRPDHCSGPCIWVSRGAKAVPAEMVTISIRPDIRVLHGELSETDLVSLREWIRLNNDVLIAHWNGKIPSSKDAIAAIRPIPKTIRY